MNAKNKRGPMTVPWGTPESTSASDDFVRQGGRTVSYGGEMTLSNTV